MSPITKHPMSFPYLVKFNNFYTVVFNLTVMTTFQIMKFVSLLSINSAYKTTFQSVKRSPTTGRGGPRGSG